jgi:hypothetical protein
VIVVNCDLEPGVALVARAVVVLVGAVGDDVYADLVVVLDLLCVAFDLAAACTGVGVHSAVLDRLAAGVVGNLHLVSFAVETCARALLVHAVVDGLDAHVLVPGELVAVHALQALAVAVLVVAVGNRDHAAVVCGECVAFIAGRALAAVALTALVGAHGLARQRGADVLGFRVCQRDAVLVCVVGVA